MNTPALLSFPVGVVVERHKATSPWLDYVWRPVLVLAGVPAAAPWTLLRTDAGIATFYAGTATVALYRTETANYLSNLKSGAPSLWVVLRPREADFPYEVLAVTADPAEGEAFAEAGNDLIEMVPMPASLIAALEAFIAEHHVERPHYKRQRDTPAEPASKRRRSGEGTP